MNQIAQWQCLAREIWVIKQLFTCQLTQTEFTFHRNSLLHWATRSQHSLPQLIAWSTLISKCMHQWIDSFKCYYISQHFMNRDASLFVDRRSPLLHRPKWFGTDVFDVVGMEYGQIDAQNELLIKMNCFWHYTNLSAS